MARLLRRFFFLALLAAAMGGGAYVQSEGFSRKWCGFVMEQFEQRNIYLTLDRLTLDPLEGLVARNIKLYQGKERQVLLMEMDRLNLDLDYGKMLRKELFLDGVDLRQADVSLPMNPEDAQSERLQITGLNARLFLVGDRIELRKAEGTLYGVKVNLSGSLLRPQDRDREETEEEQKIRRRKQIAALQARRNLVIGVAQMLRNFESATAPTLDIQFHGDMEKPEELTASLLLKANGLRHGQYVCEELEAEAAYAGETVDLSRFHVKDRLGKLEGSAIWQWGGDHVDFHVRSTADLPGFASSLFPHEALREVVFYEPVEVVADGRYLLGKSVPEGAFLPLQCVGSLSAQRFATRGEVMEGLEASFGMTPEGWHFRDGLLRHATGTMSLQAMWQKSQGLRYKGILQMSPKVFLPFVTIKETRDILNFFEMSEQSTFYAEFEGGGNAAQPDSCVTHAKGEARHFRYRGMEVTHVSSDMEFAGPVNTFRHVRLEREDGLASAKEVVCHMKNHTIKLVQTVSDVDPVQLVNCFDPRTANVISSFRPVGTSHVTLDGLICVKAPGTDLKVGFQSAGSAEYKLWDTAYLIRQPAGDLHFKNGKVAYDVTGSLFGEPMTCQGVTSLLPDVHDCSVNLTARRFPYEVFGKPLPFGQLKVQMKGRQGQADFKVQAELFDGSFELVGEVDHASKPQAFQGEIRVSSMEFKKFARVYSPDNETDGDITGHFTFAGKLGDWKALRGDGALTILNGNLYAVPVLGPLTPLLGALLPRPIAGYNLAREADCTFTVADGFVNTDNFEALTGVFRLVAKGSIDYLDDRIKFEAQARMRGLPGLVFFPVSEILEYVGEGSVGEPLWRPRYFSASKEKKDFRKTETVSEDEPLAGSPLPPARQSRSERQPAA